MVYFLTGAAGFIGANLVERLVHEDVKIHLLLKKDSDTWRISHFLNLPKIVIHYEDIQDKKEMSTLLSHVQPQVIYHLAAHGAYAQQNNPEEIFQTNIRGTLHLLEAVKNLPLELFVHTGSSSEYGFKDHPMSEAEVVSPDSFYAVSKATASQLCQLYAQKWQVPTVTLRLFSIFGPLEEPGRLMPTLLHALKLQVLMQMADPSTARDFVYVADVVDLLLHVQRLKKHTGEIFNLGSGVQTSLLQLTKIAQKVTHKKGEFEWKAVSNKSWDKSTWVADMKKTNDLLHWQPRYSLSEGLAAFWEWYSTHDQIYHSMLH